MILPIFISTHQNLSMIFEVKMILITEMRDLVPIGNLHCATSNIYFHISAFFFCKWIIHRKICDIQKRIISHHFNVSFKKDSPVMDDLTHASSI